MTTTSGRRTELIYRDPIQETRAAFQGAFRGLQNAWDGQPRLDTWLADYCGAGDTPLNRAIGRLSLVAAVRRVRQPGTQYPYMVVLDGSRNASAEGVESAEQAIEILALKKDWLKPDFEFSRDGGTVFRQVAGKLIIGVQDFDGSSRTRRAAIKTNLSRKTDRGRIKGVSGLSDVERSCTFWGTAMRRTFLQNDGEGEFRILPVEVGEIDLLALKRDIDQLYGEAAHIEAQGESIELPRDVWDDAAALRAQKVAKDIRSAARA